MTTDEERPIDLSGLDEVPVPDHWDSILARAAASADSEGAESAPGVDGSVGAGLEAGADSAGGGSAAADGFPLEGASDAGGSDGAARSGSSGAGDRRPLLVAAAVLVVVLIGVGVWAVGSDDDGEVGVAEDGGAAGEGVDPGALHSDSEGIWERDWELVEIRQDDVALELPTIDWDRGGPVDYTLEFEEPEGVVSPEVASGAKRWLFPNCNLEFMTVSLIGGVLWKDTGYVTERGCGDQGFHALDEAVLLLLHEGATVDIRGDVLTLRSASVTARFAAKGSDASEVTSPEDPSDIWDRRWMLTEVTRDGAPLEMPPGPFVLQVVGGVGPGDTTPPGTWIFRACNVGGGSLALEGDVVRSEVWGSDDMGCEDSRLHDLDDAIGKLLSGGPRVELRQGILTLTSGEIVARFVSLDDLDDDLASDGAGGDTAGGDAGGDGSDDWTDGGRSATALRDQLAEEHRGLLDRDVGAEFVYSAVVEGVWTEPVSRAAASGTPAQGRLMARLRVTEVFEGDLAVGDLTTVWYGTAFAEPTMSLPDVVSDPAAVGGRVLVMSVTSADPADEGIQIPALDGIDLLSLDPA